VPDNDLPLPFPGPGGAKKEGEARDKDRPAAAPAPGGPISVSQEDWMRRETELRSLRAWKQEQDREKEAADAERIRLLAESGQAQEALKQTTERYEQKLKSARERMKQIEGQWLDQQLDSAIGKALEGRQFSGEDPSITADILRNVLRSEVEAVRDESGNAVVRDKKTMRPASDYLAERLDSPALSLFFAPKHKGGAGTEAGRPGGGPPGDNANDPHAVWARGFLERQNAARQGRFVGVNSN
jgi:hypothetical protein